MEYRGLKITKIVIIGPPSSGKTRIAQIISKKYKIPHIFTKEIIETVKSLNNELG